MYLTPSVHRFWEVFKTYLARLGRSLVEGAGWRARLSTRVTGSPLSFLPADSRSNRYDIGTKKNGKYNKL